ncbi:hypothetical protein A9Q91_05355 [Candidatus Gracilibacteria bacterium 28_42_T64]|nr:hypothetical protein A9Q91_05355 [Candidatus Gracilibacteria bacterium 28_42_T64]
MDTSIQNNIQDLNLEELQKLLQEVKLYRDLSKKLGNRGKDLFNRGLKGEKLLVVEYFPKLNEKEVYTQAVKVYDKSFHISPKQEEILFLPNEKLSGGIKVYMDDSMIDISFSKIEKLMLK